MFYDKKKKEFVKPTHAGRWMSAKQARTALKYYFEDYYPFKTKAQKEKYVMANWELVKFNLVVNKRLSTKKLMAIKGGNFGNFEI
jgi:hypothetical protein